MCIRDRGSVERFFGVLIEHFAGAFPAWLAPVQAEVLPVSGKFSEYAQKVTADLKAEGFRAHLDDRNEKLQAKIRDAQIAKVPYMLIIGGKEAEAVSYTHLDVYKRQAPGNSSASTGNPLFQLPSR